MGRYTIVGIHILAWASYLLLLLLGTERPNTVFWINTASTFLPIIAFFYLNIYFLFPSFLQMKKFVPLISLLILFSFMSIGARLMLVSIFRQSDLDNFFSDFFSQVLFWNQFRVNLLFIGISFAYWFAVKSYTTERNQQQLEREILFAKLNSLKHQINPHFLYNTLSLLYTRSLPHSHQLAGAIAKLSDMMRYSLGDTGDDGKVLLEQEILHIRNFIELQQMRFDNRLNISLEIDGNPCQCRIMPLLLITFVENAFKHGKFNEENSPMLIRLSIDQRMLSFEIRNKKANWKKEEAHGIGLENVRSRLQLVYPQQHELSIRDTIDEFIVQLTINLHP